MPELDPDLDFGTGELASPGSDLDFGDGTPMAAAQEDDGNTLTTGIAESAKGVARLVPEAIGGIVGGGLQAFGDTFGLESVENAGEKFSSFIDRKIAESAIAKGEDLNLVEDLSGDVGGGFGTAGLILGATALNPIAGVATLGALVAPSIFDTFNEARDKGASKEAAGLFGATVGVGTFALEKKGIGKIMDKIPGIKQVRKSMGKRADSWLAGTAIHGLREGATEGAESLLQSAVEAGYDGDKRDLEALVDAAKDALRGAVVGGIVGSTVGGAVDAAQKSPEKWATETVKEANQELSNEIDSDPSPVPSEAAEIATPIDEPAVVEAPVGDTVQEQTPVEQSGDIADADPVPVNAELESILEDPDIPQEIKDEALAEASETAAEGQRERSFSRIIDDPEVFDATARAGLAPEIYETLPNSETISIAVKEIGEVGIDATERAVLTSDNTSEKQRLSNLAKGQILIRDFAEKAKGLRADGKLDDARIMDERASLMYKTVARNLTQAGREVQLGTLFNKLSPEAKYNSVMDAISEVYSSRVKGHSSEINAVRDVLNKVNRDSAESVAADVVADPIIQSTIKNKIAKNRSNKALSDKVSSRLKSHITSKSSTVMPIKRMLDEIFTISKEALPELKKESRSDNPIDMIQQALDHPHIYREVFFKSRNKVEEFVRNRSGEEGVAQFQEFFETVIGQPISDKTLNDAISNEATAIGLDLSQVVKDRLVDQVEASTGLARAIASRLDISEADSQTIERRINELVTSRLSDIKAKALERALGNTLERSPKKRKNFYQDMIELSNLGALDSTMFADAFSDRFGLPKLDDAFKADLKQKVSEVDNATREFGEESIQSVKKQQELQDMIAKKTGFTKKDAAISFYYNSMLSGPRTLLETNPLGSFLNTSMETFVRTMDLPIKAQAEVWKRYFKELKDSGFTDVKSIVVEGGQVPRLGEKVTTSRYFETKDFKGMFKALNGLKYINRSITAGDALFYRGGQYAAAYEKTLRDVMAQEGLTRPNKKVYDEVEYRMGESAEFIEDMKKKVSKESGLDTDIEKDRRLQQLLRSRWGDEVDQYAHNVASRGTLTNDPEGILGFAAKKLREGGDRSLALRAVVPFTRIVSNVTNAGLDYGLVGYKRALFGRNNESAPVGREKEVALRKGHTGILAATAVAGMAVKAMMDDEEDPFFEVTASGPREYSKQYQLRSNGWRPYSIKVGGKWYPYWQSPLGLTLGSVGAFMDHLRYNKDRDDGFMETVAVMALGQARLPLEQSFMSNLSELMGAISSDGPGAEKNAIRKIQNLMTRTATTLAIPAKNLGSQVGRMIYPFVGDTERSFAKSILRQIPVVGSMALEKKQDVLGNDVEVDRPIIDTFPIPFIGGPDAVSEEESAMIYDYVYRKRAFIPEMDVSKTNLLSKSDISVSLSAGDESGTPAARASLGVPISPEDFRVINKKRGEIFREKLRDPELWTLMEGLEESRAASEVIKLIMNEAKREAKREYAGLPRHKPQTPSFIPKLSAVEEAKRRMKHNDFEYAKD